MSIADKLNDIWELVAAVFSDFNVSDFLDICLVAFVIYNGIKLIRETRAIQLVKGIALLGVIYVIISALKMQASDYIFDRLFTNIFLVLIVLFQPEIRHAVETMGRTRFSKWGGFLSRNEQLKYNERTKECINAVYKACSDMSDRRIGALLVFERETLLGEIIETGTVINADISREMIRSIFFPQAPLHDGAVVIRENKLHAAGCILPLTANHEFSSELGTRHRAALGMSERSDSLTVIVSEETGHISTAYKGLLKRNISDGELREILNELLLIRDDRESASRLRVLLGSKKNKK
ncbi:MAG: diadenylate cyclase CdaA [Oscillospiraceae bacterium]|nr:diadenylate cyclase CdaA [Oscillospiraceae bacterium]